MWRVVGCLALVACATGVYQLRAPAPVVHVVNDNWSMMRVYSNVHGMLMPAGEVQGQQAVWLTVRPDGTSTCQVTVQAFVSDEAWDSEALPCAPGDTFELHVQPYLPTTMLVPRRTP